MALTAPVGGARYTDVPHAVGVVTSFFGAALEAVESWRHELAADLAAAGGAGHLTVAQADGLVEPYARTCFSVPGLPVYGAGFVAARGLLVDANNHLAWWQGSQQSQLTLATQAIDKEHIDYSGLEWYRVPMTTGAAHIAGPYVDYLCSDEYTVTAAVPVYLDGEFAGVAGLDLLVDGIERQLVPLLEDEEVDFTIVNGLDRVVLSTDPRRATGDSLRSDPTLLDLRRFPCPDLPLAVLAG